MFIDRAPCTKLHKREQKDRTKTLPEFPNHVLKDYELCHVHFNALGTGHKVCVLGGWRVSWGGGDETNYLNFGGV